MMNQAPLQEEDEVEEEEEAIEEEQSSTSEQTQSPLRDDVYDLLYRQNTNANNSTLYDANNHNVNLADKYMKEMLGDELWKKVSPLLTVAEKAKIGQSFRQQLTRINEGLKRIDREVADAYQLHGMVPTFPTNLVETTALAAYNKKAIDYRKGEVKERENIVRVLMNIPFATGTVDYFRKLVGETRNPMILLPRGNDAVVNNATNMVGNQVGRPPAPAAVPVPAPKQNERLAQELKNTQAQMAEMRKEMTRMKRPKMKLVGHLYLLLQLTE